MHVLKRDGKGRTQKEKKKKKKRLYPICCRCNKCFAPPLMVGQTIIFLYSINFQEQFLNELFWNCARLVLEWYKNSSRTVYGLFKNRSSWVWEQAGPLGNPLKPLILLKSFKTFNLAEKSVKGCILMRKPLYLAICKCKRGWSKYVAFGNNKL